MRISVKRHPIRFFPDFRRVILRFHGYSDDRTKSIISRVSKMREHEVNTTLHITLREFAKRHRSISAIFQKHFDQVKHLLKSLKLKEERFSRERQLLIGSYFTMEYSIESTAFFNPSIVEAPDQSDLEEGQKRVIVSFRAIGEGHISSIVFRAGLIDKDNNLQFREAGDRIGQAEIIKHRVYDKVEFSQLLMEMSVSKTTSALIMDGLSDNFSYQDLSKVVDEVLAENTLSIEKEKELREVMWLADSHYEINFSVDTDISERVIFPVSSAEKKGIEDARFVRFQEDDGTIVYYATYTAYDGFTILPKIIRTTDFYRFRTRPLRGAGAQNKNLALFPKKIKGKYAMISRIDGYQNYIMFSDNNLVWEDPIKLQEPKYPWEYVQLGNCGSPLETKRGWLLLTHAVGPMRRYCLGASLLDKENPSIELGRLKEPLLVPNKEEREGYVPNVVYSCGAIIHNDEVVIPYAMSDYASSFISVPLELLLDKIIDE